MKTLVELSSKYAHFDKRSIGYLPLYEMLFSPIRDSVRKVLEIGVQSGNSIRLWRDFFPNAMIYGWDIDQRSVFSEDRIFISILNHDDKKSVMFNLDQIGNDIDIIVEDGSHTMKSQQSLLAWCLNHVKSGGIYVTEDIGTSFPKRGHNYGLNQDRSNSTYKCFERFVYSGNFVSAYVSKEEKEYIEANTNHCMMYSTIRKYPDDFKDLPVEDWPTFPIFVLRKR